MGASDVVAWAKAQVGNGYVWGGDGRVCTPEYRADLARQFPAQAGNLLGVCAQWDGVPVYDCARFVRAGLALLGLKLEYTVNYQYNQPRVWASGGAVKDLPSGVLAVLFRESADVTGKFSHDGLRLPDGTTVEAMDSKNGVVHRTIMSSKWTHYKIPMGAEIDAGDTDEPADSTTPEPGTVTVIKTNVRMRKQPKIVDGANHNRICTLPDNYTAPIIERRDGWTRIPYLIHKGWVRDDMLQFN